MKKLLSILLLIIILCAPIIGICERVSPSVESLYKFNPEIKFESLEYNTIKSNLDYWDPFTLLKKFNNNINL